jgi:hypothetical protein
MKCLRLLETEYIYGFPNPYDIELREIEYTIQKFAECQREACPAYRPATKTSKGLPGTKAYCVLDEMMEDAK